MSLCKDAFIFSYPELRDSIGPQAIVVLKKDGKSILYNEYIFNKENYGLIRKTMWMLQNIRYSELSMPPNVFDFQIEMLYYSAERASLNDWLDLRRSRLSSELRRFFNVDSHSNAQYSSRPSGRLFLSTKF